MLAMLAHAGERAALVRRVPLQGPKGFVSNASAAAAACPAEAPREADSVVCWAPQGSRAGKHEGGGDQYK